EEYTAEFFELPEGETSPYMLLVTPVRPSKRLAENDSDSRQGLARLAGCRSTIPAVTHVDYSARVQTVDRRHGRLRLLLERFHGRTRCPVLINTSFNVRDEPIVCTPADALRCFHRTQIDVLVLGRCVLRKTHATDSPESYAAR